MKALVLLHKAGKRAGRKLHEAYSSIATGYLLKANQVKVGRGFGSLGVPIIDVALKGSFQAGDHFRLNNGHRYNRIGRQARCMFVVGPGASLQIGDNVGMSSSTIVCMLSVRLGSNVKIGGNCVIYDTDFHSLDFEVRRDRDKDYAERAFKPVTIGDDVFIGAHSTILKGVSIGDRAIIGAGSVVSKSIPAGEIWGGNPIRFIKKLEEKA